jgi:hypothetical protein
MFTDSAKSVRPAGHAPFCFPCAKISHRRLHTQVLAAILEVVGNRGGNQRLAPTANDRNAQRSTAAPESGENGPAKARLRAVRPQLDAVPGPYQITKRLPAAEDGEFQYEIRTTLEEYNRVARESDLTRT